MLRRLLLLLALLVMPGVAHAEWYEASTPHFVVYSDDSPEAVKRFATNLERFDKALRFLRNLSDEPIGKANRVTIYLLKDVAAIGRLAGNSGVAGFYIPRAGGSVAFAPRRADEGNVPPEFRDLLLSPLQILLHEYTHHFLLSLSPNVAYPAWFVEGYSEFFAPSVFEADGSVIIGRPPQYRSWDLQGSEQKLSMTRMLTTAPRKLNPEQRYLIYARGWLLTHYLFISGKRDGQLGAYLRALTEGKTPEEAAQAFGDLRKLDSELWTYRRTELGAQRISAAALPVGEVTIRKLGPAEAATMDVRIRSDRGVNEDQAKDVYAAARAACAPYPNDPAAQRVLTEAAFDAGDFAGAEAAADRILTVQPNNVDALLYKARARMAVAVKAKDMTPATWTPIRRLIATANKADTENPAVLWLFYQSYVQAGIKPSQAAKDGLYYAYVLAPQDRTLRFDVAESYLRDGNLAQARALLLTIARDAHAGTSGELADRVIDAIEAGNPAAAIEEIDKSRREAEEKAKGKRKG
ncbi:MAG: hypothetical protein ACAH11_08140 [Sphingomonas sp.]